MSKTESYLRISNVVFEEFIMREFSKRQRKIIDFILRLSWGCNKNEAVIPRLKYFEACGVCKSDIRQELEFLVLNKVLFWEESTNMFEINKAFHEWAIPYVRQYNKKLFNEVLSLNLSFSSKNKKEDDSVGKTPTKLVNFPNKVSEKHQQRSSQNACTNSVSGGFINSNYKNSLYGVKKNVSTDFSSFDTYDRIKATKKIIEEKEKIVRSSPLDDIRSRQDAIEYLKTFPPALVDKINSNKRLIEEYGICVSDLG